MQVFLETERLVLRRFTMADADNLAGLDADPDVMRFITGGCLPPGRISRTRSCRRSCDYYERFEGYGFWAAIEKSTGEFLGWFHFRPADGAAPARPSSATGCASRPGAGVTPPRDHRADPQGLHRVRRAARDRGDDGGEYGLPAGDGESGPDAGADLSSVLAVRDRGRRSRRRRVCAVKTDWEQQQQRDAGGSRAV